MRPILPVLAIQGLSVMASNVISLESGALDAGEPRGGDLITV